MTIRKTSLRRPSMQRWSAQFPVPRGTCQSLEEGAPQKQRTPREHDQFVCVQDDVGGSSVYLLLSLINKETALAFDRTAA